MVSDFLVSAVRFTLEPETSCAQAQILRATIPHCPPKTNYRLILLFIRDIKTNPSSVCYTANPVKEN